MAEVPTAGSVSPELASEIHQIWADAAARAGHDVAGFDPTGSLEERLAWAAKNGFDIAAILARYSSKMQHSTEAQVQECVRFAAAHKNYAPPEYVCIDEGVSGRKVHREGLERMKGILAGKLARVLLVYKVSRLFRLAFRGFQFFQEEVVEEGLRAISVSQGIDTAEQTTWKQLCLLHGIMDEMLLTTIADHVRSGIAGLFRAGFVTGALTVGYMGREITGARPTNRGLPRRQPVVDSKVAPLIRQHYEWIREGVPIKECWRRWVRAGGPKDPRSSSDQMTYAAYRRMLSNPRYTGRWAFGRRRNDWSSKRDYMRQVEQPETEVILVQSDDLRIVSDELFFGVQERLATLKIGPRGPKRRKDVRLWDLVTGCFFCAACSTPGKPVRLYQAGANGKGMRCKRGDLCPASTIIRREPAVRAVCQELSRRLQQNTTLIEEVVVEAERLMTTNGDAMQEEQQQLDRKIAALTRKIADLSELAGEGTEEDRVEQKGRIRAAQQERARFQSERARLQKSSARAGSPITAEEIRARTADLSSLLTNAAAGETEGDGVYRAATAFRLLVGGRIEVHVQARAGRRRTNVRGIFEPRLLQAVASELPVAGALNFHDSRQAEVWLRSPPKKDLLAEAVHQLIDVEKHSFRSAATVLQSQGHRINSGVVWQVHQRYWEMRGEPVPPVPYNNGRPRKQPPA